jgi:hypothetical protein
VVLICGPVENRPKHPFFVRLRRKRESCRPKATLTRDVVEFDAPDQAVHGREFSSQPDAAEYFAPDATTSLGRINDERDARRSVVMALYVDEADRAALVEDDPTIATYGHAASELHTRFFHHELQLAPDPVSAAQEADRLGVVEPGLDDGHDLRRE